MFPIGDTEVRTRSPAYITYLLIAINTVVWLYEWSLGQNALQQFITTYGAIPAEITSGVDVYTLFTNMWLHGGWLHILGNMVFLWVFGDNVEAVLGHFPYLFFYIIGGIAASLTHVYISAASTIPSVGASGAIAAVLGAYIIMFPRAQVRLLIGYGFITRVSAILFLGFWFILQLFNGVAALGVDTAQTGGVAVWAHVGGFVFGALIGLFFKGKASGMVVRR